MSISAQIISLGVSLVLNLFVPKYLGELHYSYWHTFLLYVNYVGVLHFGLLDGLVLRYAQYDYDDLDKGKLRSQFVVLLSFITVAWLALSAFGLRNNGITREIYVLVGLGVITKNIFAYNSYLFQITNRINKYASIVITQRLTFGVITVTMILLKQQNFIWFCFAELVGDTVGILLSYRSNRELYFGKLIPFRDILIETRANISSGIMLTISNWSSSFLIGGAKMIIQWYWGALIFGKASFAFSVSSLFLTFVNATSVVLFPSIKRIEKEYLPYLYKSIRDLISPILFLALLFYFPGCLILQKWLPAYQTSLVYLGILLPIITFSSKVTMLTNNYLKAYRRERTLLFINISTIVLGAILFFASAIFLNNLLLLLLFTVLVVMIRSIVSEILVMRIINIRFYSDFFVESIMTIVFIVSAVYFSYIQGFTIYLLAFLSYSVIKRKSILMTYHQVVDLQKGRSF